MVCGRGVCGRGVCGRGVCGRGGVVVEGFVVEGFVVEGGLSIENLCFYNFNWRALYLDQNIVNMHVHVHVRNFMIVVHVFPTILMQE